MAISVNWITGVITVPQADLTFISGSLYELDVDAFRLALKALEDDPDGMPWPDTHRHNTEVVLSGVIYSRFIEMLAPYTVTFEDGQYRIRTVGANHNISDVMNLNQVSLITGNSAGLQTVLSGSGLDAAQDLKLTEVHGELRAIEGGKHHSWLMRILLAAMGGKASGLDSNAPKYRDQADAKDRISAATDAFGNRTSVTLDGD